MGPALDAAFAHDSLVIVEGFSDGMEVECSVMGLDEPEASVPGEIVILKGADWYDYAAKYDDGGMELVVPARLPEAVREEVRRLAVDTFMRVGCAGLARVDFFVEGDRVLVNELNTMPGFTGRASSRSCGRRRACRPPSSATACSASRSSASSRARRPRVLGRVLVAEERDLADLDALRVRRSSVIQTR